MQPFVANTNLTWFEFLASLAEEGRLDEANFWSPKAQRPMRRMAPGEPVFFRLTAPRNCVVGYGFFAHFSPLDVELAWRLFGERNGAPDRNAFLERIGGFRGADLRNSSVFERPLGCTILRDLRLWPEDRWIRWDETRGWKHTIVQGRGEREPNASRLLSEIQYDHMDSPPDLAPAFVPLDVDERAREESLRIVREGQGAFRARLLDAYDRRCAITGERTEPVLDAAHIQPYLGPRSNHVQNGLVLTKELHALFDEGLLGIDPEGRRVRVSSRIREQWSNGRRYYEFDGRRLADPSADADAPSAEALGWHLRHVFRG